MNNTAWIIKNFNLKSLLPEETSFWRYGVADVFDLTGEPKLFFSSLLISLCEEVIIQLLTGF